MHPTNKKFLNNGKYVEEMIEGMIHLFPNQLRKMKGHNILVRSDILEVKHTQVSIVSGGGSGHEPAMG